MRAKELTEIAEGLLARTAIHPQENRLEKDGKKVSDKLEDKNEGLLVRTMLHPQENRIKKAK
jgi:hypothetical protein